ncbi:ABC transporter permease [Deinococcus ruber]|uniref:ABC transporter permease n=1 Tax=Deinococcus ruber TaxID=1848197 RepID=A0A918C2L4_9DEIO|nr:ABC transporter permease [Deinococcus ruber]GGR01569.1 ABC transporter permease [Deinococcus ruber]
MTSTLTNTDARPSAVAARLSLAFAAFGILALFLFPFGTYTRNFNAAATVQRFPAGVLDFTGFPPASLPAVTGSLAFGWVTLVALLLVVFAAVRRQKWLWVAGLVALIAAVVSVVLWNSALAGATQALLDKGIRPRRIPFTSGGINMGLFFALLAGLVGTFAGLSQFRSWWDRLNRLRGLLVPVVAISLAILVGAVVVLVVQAVPSDPSVKLNLFTTFVGKSDVVWFVFSSLFAPITNLSGAVDSLKLATPLIFAGLSVAFAFRAGLFNIGASGQLTMGAILATLVGVYAPLPGPLLAIAAVLAAAVGGALWGAIPGLLKARFGSSEVINTIMLNYIASGIFVFLLGSNTYTFFGRTVTIPFKAEGSNPSSNLLQPAAQLPSIPQMLGLNTVGPGHLTLGPIFAVIAGVALYYGLRRNRWRALVAVVGALLIGLLTWRIGVPLDVTAAISNSRLNSSLLLALLAAVLFSVLMWRTATGYALRAVGLSPKAAEYGGISVARNTILAMTLAGAFAGLASTHYVMGGALDEYRLKQNIPVNVGFDGITVALVGQSTPVGVVLSSILFGTFDSGSVAVSSKLSGVNKDLVTVLKALIVLFIAAGGFLSKRITDPPPLALVKAVDAGVNVDKQVVAVQGNSVTALPNVGAQLDTPGSDRTTHSRTPNDGTQGNDRGGKA